MTYRTPALAAALALTLATLGQAGAADLGRPNAGPQGATVPAVISVAYHDPRIATRPAEVLRQGGLSVAGTARWLPAATEPTFSLTAFDVPAVIGAAYHQRNVATTAAEVRRQGGYATAGSVHWLPTAPAVTEAKVEAIRLGAL